MILSNSDTIRKLKDVIKNALDSALSEGQSFALLDFPDHDNIGDSAIYCGEMEYFRSFGRKPSYCSTTNNYSHESMIKSIGDGPIFMHGGGNFGTLWQWFQPFREMVIEQNAGRKIIQFPQTIHYRSQSEIDKTARLIERHGNFILLVRDHKSYELALKNFQCEVLMAPDMAFYMGSLRSESPANKFLFHLRTDQEAAGEYDTSELLRAYDAIRLDWPVEPPEFRSKVDKSILLPLVLAGLRGGRQGFRERRYRGLADARLRRGIELLSRGEKVVTNRLHGHILCYLMDIPHCVIDNSYGKTSSFMDAWGTGGGNVHRADTVEEAIASLS